MDISSSNARITSTFSCSWIPSDYFLIDKDTNIIYVVMPFLFENWLNQFQWIIITRIILISSANNQMLIIIVTSNYTFKVILIFKIWNLLFKSWIQITLYVKKCSSKYGVDHFTRFNWNTIIEIFESYHSWCPKIMDYENIIYIIAPR